MKPVRTHTFNGVCYEIIFASIDPRLREKRVARLARETARFLWRLGYRRADLP